MNRILNSYSKGFLDALKVEAINELMSKKEIINLCFSQKDFLEVLKNPFILPKEKLHFVLHFIDIDNEDLKRAFLILSEANGLIFLQEILDKIEESLQEENKVCKAVLLSAEKIDPHLIEIFRKELQRQIGYEIVLQERRWDHQGVKCYIDELGLEISFSQRGYVENLKNIILSSIYNL